MTHVQADGDDDARGGARAGGRGMPATAKVGDVIEGGACGFGSSWKLEVVGGHQGEGSSNPTALGGGEFHHGPCTCRDDGRTWDEPEVADRDLDLDDRLPCARRARAGDDGRTVRG